MRWTSGTPLTIAISASVHIALFAVAHTWTPTPAPAPTSPVVIELIAPAPPPPEEPPTEVVLLDEPQIAALPTPVAPVPVDHKHQEERVSAVDRATNRTTLVPPTDSTATDSTTTDSATRTDSTTTTPSPDRPTHPTLSMRRPGDRPDLSLPRTRWDDLEHAPAGTAPTTEVRSGKLAPDGTGTKSDQGTFVAKVDRDGHVKIKDAKNFNIHIALPSAKDIGDALQAWYYDPNKPIGTLPPPNMKTAPHDNTVSGAERLGGDDRTIYGEDHGPSPSESGAATMAILGGGFDVTDAFMRRHGQDPYAAQKLAFLDSTRDERVQIGKKHRSEQLAQVSQIVQKNLARAWATATTPAARKRALFEMWDECVEIGSTEVVVAATQARKLIVGFIRANFPASGVNPYSAAELAAFNREKQSRATFAPYETTNE